MNKIYEPIINEEAYLSEEEEREVIDFALKNIDDKNMTFEESEKYLEKFPALRMFAGAYRDLFGEDGYNELEKENVEIIRTRAWENE